MIADRVIHLYIIKKPPVHLIQAAFSYVLRKTSHV
jgi:hypothetical protein